VLARGLGAVLLSPGIHRAMKVPKPEGQLPDRRPRVVVVDDDPLSSALQSHLASLFGYDAFIETDPGRAIAHATDGSVDAMLLDLGMPGMDGFELLARVRRDEGAHDRKPLPVIAITGYASDMDRLRCLMAGFSDHLGKPIQAAALAAALGRALGLQPVATEGADATHGDAPARVPPPGAAASAGSDADRLRAAVRKLAEVRADVRSFAPTVTESFAMRSNQLIEALRLAAQVRDAPGVARHARALQASGDFLGATRLGQMCALLEHQARSGAWDEIDQQLDALDHEHQAVLTLMFESPR